MSRRWKHKVREGRKLDIRRAEREIMDKRIEEGFARLLADCKPGKLDEMLAAHEKSIDKSGTIRQDHPQLDQPT